MWGLLYATEAAFSDPAATVQIYLAVLATMAVPWAAWVSLKLMKLDKDTGAVEARHDTEITDLKERVAKIEGLFQTKLRDF